MKLLIISSEPFYKHNNLYSNYVIKQADKLKSFGHEITVFCFSFVSYKDFMNEKEIVSLTEENSIPIFKIHIPAFIPYRYMPWILRFAIVSVFARSFIKKRVFNFDLQICNNFLFGSYLAKMIKDKFGIPFLILEHSSFYLRYDIPQFVINQYIKIQQHATALYTVSEYLKCVLEKKINLNIHGSIHNAIDDIFLNEMNTKQLMKSNCFKLVSVGNLVDVKNHSLLIDTIFRLRNKGFNINLLIIGSGILKSTLIKQIDNRNLNENIKIFSCDRPEKLIDYFDESDAFVHFSKFETFGIVVVEAMMRGLPCFITPCGGPEFMIKSFNGIVSSFEIDVLVNDFIHFLNHLKDYNQGQIREFAIHNFGNNAYSKNISKILSL